MRSALRGHDALTRLLFLGLLGVGYLRLLVGVVAGALLQFPGGDDFPGVTDEHLATRLRTFGEGGGFVVVTIAVLALAIVWWRTVERRPDRRGLTLLRLFCALAAIATSLSCAGEMLSFPDLGSARAQVTLTIGFPLCDVLLLGVVFVGAGRLRWIGDDDDDASDDTIVFAVDKGNGNVFAYFSLEQAERRMSVFSVEDGEFDLYTDDGTVLSGQVEAGMNVFAGTDERRPDELRAALDAFVQRREIPVDVDDEDPMAAYAVAIADWQWLELWPAWMRPLARLLPIRRGG